jgi:hypothetical protein
VKPIDVNELFELNPDYEVVSFDGQIMIIDNWYKNYDQIIEVMEQQTPVYYNYVTSSGIQPDNGKKYHDCRVLLTNTSLDEKYISTLKEIEKIITKGSPGLELTFTSPGLVFNYWKNENKNLRNNIQSLPHVDSPAAFACVIYLDKICSGGTNIYDIEENVSVNPGLVDITNFQQTFKYKVVKSIKAKPNRMVIYPGNIWHGAFIEDHSKYVDEWRINQVHFINIHNKNNKE